VELGTWNPEPEWNLVRCSAFLLVYSTVYSRQHLSQRITSSHPSRSAIVSRTAVVQSANNNWRDVGNTCIQLPYNFFTVSWPSSGCANFHMPRRSFYGATHLHQSVNSYCAELVAMRLGVFCSSFHKIRLDDFASILFYERY
jgi:hypothetical protein